MRRGELGHRAPVAIHAGAGSLSLGRSAASTRDEHPTKITTNHTVRLWTSALTLTICSWLTIGCRTTSVLRSEIVTDSVRDFSGEQGANGWFYGYWNRTADTDQGFYQTTDFQLLKHFGNDPINQVSSHPDFATGKLWTLQDGLYYTALWADGGSANGTTKLAPQAKVEQWAVRRWVSTVHGPVTISGQAAEILDWGGVDSGQARIVVDGATVFSAATHGMTTNYSVNATVRIGSRVDFLITAGPPATGGAFGPVKFTATLRAAP
jgi:hypothetical protein